MNYTPEMRKQISKTAKGQVVQSLEWTDADGGYWVMTFTNGSKMCFRFLAELVG